MLDEAFNQIGLGPTHQEIYLVLLEMGAMPAGEIAKRLDLPRSTIYGLLEEMVDKGVIVQSQKWSIKVWQIISPEKISGLISDKIKSLSQIKTGLETVLPKLIAKNAGKLTSPRFTYYEGREGIKQIFKDVIMYRDIETECLWPYKDMMEVIDMKFLVENNQIERIKRNISLRVIWPKNKVVDVKKYPHLGVSEEFLRETRIAPASVDISMGYWAYANKVAFISSKRESFGFIVESMDLRQLIKAQFDELWKHSKPLRVNPKDTQEFVDRYLKNL
ncbi:MAG: helix-turn-helix domain-containing protein [Candidatus Paceibacterota bacterium]|jgi:sugar-specific transcriptional regulator TrmB